jgi:transcription antitermination factor NusG
VPILAQETSIYPADLLACSAETDGRRWWAVYTKPRQEKSLARQLLGFGIPFYLPLVSKENLIRGRRVQSFIPLFGGYLFVRGTDEERSRSLTTNRIATILPVRDESSFQSDLSNVARLIEADAPLTVERRLVPGQWVRIKAGSMAGMEGTVLRRQGKTRLVVAVQLLQQGVSVEVDDFLLEPLN